MTYATYVKFEVLRAFRNRRFFIFSVGFPLVFYVLLAGTNRNEKDFLDSGISAAQYYMVGLLAFGAMAAALGGGARIAVERQIGWNRQLRLTPLTPAAYFRAKVVTSYLTVLLSMVLLYLLGTAYGVRLSAGQWLQMTGLVLIALIPFVALGIAMGHLLTSDSLGPALGGGVGLLAFLGGTWFPIQGGGLFVGFCKLLPSYWLVQAGRVGLGERTPWTAEGWLVMAAWAAATIVFAMWAYRRDTSRV